MHGGGMEFMMFGMLLWVLLIIVVSVVAVRWFGKRMTSGGKHADSNTAEEILDERFARGEINEEEYLERKGALEYHQ